MHGPLSSVSSFAPLLQRCQIILTSGLCRQETGAGVLRIEDSAGHVVQKVLEEGFFDLLNKVCISFLLVN
jgi:hypothetical protein